jgi:hypothetical protein
MYFCTLAPGTHYLDTPSSSRGLVPIAKGSLDAYQTGCRGFLDVRHSGVAILVAEDPGPKMVF